MSEDENINRCRITESSFGGVEVKADPNGDWVRWEIAEAALERVRDLEAAIREHREAYADNRWASGDVSNKLWAALGGAGEG